MEARITLIILTKFFILQGQAELFEQELNESSLRKLFADRLTGKKRLKWNGSAIMTLASKEMEGREN